MSLKSTDFFLKGTHQQFEWVLGQYQVRVYMCIVQSTNDKTSFILKIFRML